MAEELKFQNCGKGFLPTCHITRQKFCSDASRIKWWREYHKANPSEEEPAHEENCEWCGEKFLDYSGQGRRYCGRSCWISAQYAQQGTRGGRRRISADSLEEWKEKPAQAAEADNTEKRRKRVRLACGTTSMNTGLLKFVCRGNGSVQSLCK